MQDIFDHIEGHLDESIQLLTELVRQPSVSSQGIGFDKAPGLVKSMFEAHGMEVEIIPVPNDGPPVVLGSSDGESNNTLLFYTHYDVQPTDPLELWESDPFEPERRGDRLFGRGMSDDKGNIAARLAAIRAFKDVRGKLPCNLKFLSEGEEEIGSRNLRPVIEQRGEDFKADACIWEGGGRNLNNDPFMYQGLKGILTIELRNRQLSGDAHSSLAAILPSAAWRLIHALATIRDADERILVPGFYDAVKPPSPSELDAAAKLPDQSRSWRETFGAGRFVGNADTESLETNLLFHPTANVAGLACGYTGQGMKTVLPDQASAKMDFRLVPDQRPRDIFQKIRTHLDAKGFGDVEVELMGAVNPARTEIDSPWVQLVAETAREVYGRQPVIAPNMPGTGPWYDFGVTLDMPISTSGVDHPSHRIHAPNENIAIEDFLLGAKHAALIMERFGEKGPGHRTSSTE